MGKIPDSEAKKASAHGFEIGKEIAKHYDDEKHVMNVLCGIVYMLILEEKITAEQGVMTIFEVAKNCSVDLQALVDLTKHVDKSGKHN
ncbi:MAG: hypothetical protein LJE74_10665 [Proteobacteria bacterium]|jgi:hypothetical protein|nr:hypothetical protein [Pseudomonadota bacterium]MCG6934818.1 hypothetical protein [Pseudomonadota bacterium]